MSVDLAASEQHDSPGVRGARSARGVRRAPKPTMNRAGAHPHRRRRAKPVASAAMLVAALSLADPARALGPRDRHLTSVRHGVSVEAPAGWTLSQHSGYGETVAVLLHPDGARISVTAAPTDAADGQALLEQNRRGLLAQGLTPAEARPGPRGFTSVDVTVPGGAERLRQLYLVRPTPQGRQAVILTLVCRASLFGDLSSALVFVAERLELNDPVPPTPPGGALPRAAGTGGAGPPLADRARATPRASSSEPAGASPGGHAGTSARAGAGGSGGELGTRDGDRKPGP